MLTGAAFLSATDTETALSELAATDALTVVVGAGVGIESRLPSWTQLVTGLIQRGSRQVLPPRSSDEQQRAFAEWSIRSDGLLAGASLARAVGQTDRDIAAVLYAASGTAPVPGPSARAIARLARETGASIVTTNYDETVEEAINELASDDDPRAVAVIGPGDPAHGIKVVHLHGLIRNNRAVGKIILDEEDYYALGSGAWQEQYLRDQLEAGPCLFVGSSMTDPNLLRYLHRATRGHRHYAVLVRQGDAYLGAEGAVDGHVEQARYTAAGRRWRDLGITVLQPEFYSDGAQFLHELLGRRSGEVTRGYRARLDSWISEFDKVYLPADSAQFADAQDFLFGTLARLKERICEIVSGATDPKDERFAVGLWVLRPGESLLLIGNSDRAHRDPDTLRPVSLAGTTDWTAVDTFRSGTPQARDVEHRFGTRWNAVIGCPVSVESSDYGRLQVGAVTIAGTESYDQSALSPDRLGPIAFNDIARAATDVATGLLLPERHP